jgi:hypothetical protein
MQLLHAYREFFALPRAQPPKPAWKMRWTKYMEWREKTDRARGVKQPPGPIVYEQQWMEEIAKAIRRGERVPSESMDYLHRTQPMWMEHLLVKYLKKNSKYYTDTLVRWLRHRKWWDKLKTPSWAIQPDVENELQRRLEQEAAKGKAKKPPKRKPKKQRAGTTATSS